MKQYTLNIVGQFTEQDLEAFAKLVRQIEQRTGSHYSFTIRNDETALADAQDMLSRIFPRIPGDTPVFKTIEKSDSQGKLHVINDSDLN